MSSSHNKTNNDNNPKDDASLFKKAMKYVSPLKKSGKVSQHKTSRTSGTPFSSTSKGKHKKKRPPTQHEIASERHSEATLSDQVSHEVTGDEMLTFMKDGVQPRYFRKLKRGAFAIEAELDLHGKKIDEARTALVDFILLSQEDGLRCVRIIHGKGHRSSMRCPLMKNMVNSWLKQLPYILAFSSCLPRDGGTGALYVLLKRHLTR